MKRTQPKVRIGLKLQRHANNLDSVPICRGVLAPIDKPWNNSGNRSLTFLLNPSLNEWDARIDFENSLKKSNSCFHPGKRYRPICFQALRAQQQFQRNGSFAK